MNERIRAWIRRAGPMFEPPRLIGLYHLLSQVLAYDVVGEVVELGCHAGQSAVLLREILDHHRSEKLLHVYDSFQGLPPPQIEDAGARFVGGDMRATEDELLQKFVDLDLTPPLVHAGWFSDTLPAELPAQICFAQLDCDFYASVTASLTAVYPRLTRGGIMVIDDYGWEGLPGATRAVDDFVATTPETLNDLGLAPQFDAPHAYIRKTH